MFVIAGGTTANNRGFASRAKTDPNTSVVRYEGITVRANMKVTSVELVSEPQVDCLLPQIVAYVHGRVTSIYTGDFPGREGTMTRIDFGGGHVYTSDDDSPGIADIESVKVEEIPGFNNLAPEYTLCMRMSLAENYMVAAKGGFVPGYCDVAVPRTMVNREWQNLPMDIDVTEFNCDGQMMYLTDIVDQYGRVTNTAECGYDIASMLAISDEMRHDASRVLADEMENTKAPVEYKTVDELAAQQLVDLLEEEEELGKDADQATAEQAEAADAQASSASDDESHVKVSTFAENPFDSELDQDMAFIASMFGSSNMSPMDSLVTEEKQDQLIQESALDLGNDEGTIDFDSVDDDLNADESKTDGNKRAQHTAVSDMLIEGVDTIADAQQNTLDLSEDESKTDGNRRAAHAAITDMQMEGASSIAEAQQNAAPVVEDWSNALDSADSEFGF